MIDVGTSSADQRMVRRVNSALVVHTLRSSGSLSRAQIARRLDLNRSTVSSIVQDLVDSGYVRESRLEAPSSGRPGMLLELDPAGGCLIGVDINIDVMDAVVTDFVGRILWSRQVEFEAGEGCEAVLGRAEGLISEAMSFSLGTGSPALGLGVAVAALVDATAGAVLYAPHLGWRDVGLRRRWEEMFGLPVVVENEANAGALGEYYFGHAKEVEDFVFLSLGVSLAAGVFVNGRLLRGADGYAGQVGHTVRVHDGIVCSCGRRGCWVTQVGLPAISRRLLEVGTPAAVLPGTTADRSTVCRSHVTIAALADAAAADGSMVRLALAETGVHLGAGIADLINIFDPRTVVLGGPLSPLLPHMLERVRETVAANRLGPAREPVEVVISANGERACATGAMAAVFDAVTSGLEVG